MSNHFSAIGIGIDGPDSLNEYFKKTVESGEIIDSKNGKYIRWKLGDGAELIGKLNNQNKPLGLKPYYFGNTRYNIRYARVVKQDTDGALDGAIFGWAEPFAKTKEGTFPIVVDLPEFDVYNFTMQSVVVESQICAFSHEMSVFKSEKEYMAFQKGSKKFGVKSFVPIGMFEDDGQFKNDPEPHAIISGVVVDTKVIKSEMSGMRYRWIQLDTVGGNIDVISADGDVTRNLSAGDIIGGLFYLSARIIGEAKIPEDFEDRSKGE
jgi:hypothetical protein